jgi:hypothetical protein
MPDNDVAYLEAEMESADGNLLYTPWTDAVFER